MRESNIAPGEGGAPSATRPLSSMLHPVAGMSVIAGIDFSTHAVDIVLLAEETNAAEWHRFELTDLPSWDAFDRARSVRAVMPTRSWWEDHGVIAIGIEQPRGNHGVTPLFRVQGAILACLPPDLLVQPWNPASWRVAAGMKGNAPKLAVAVFSRNLLGQTCADWPQDAHDAHFIALATRSAIEDTANAPP